MEAGWKNRKKRKGGQVGSPPTVKEELLTKVITAVKAQCQSGVEVTSSILQAVLIQKHDPTILEKNGLKFICSKSWICRLCRTVDLHMRRGTTAAQKLPPDWELQGELFAKRLSYLIMRFNMPEALVVNFDQTGLQIVPTQGVTRCLNKGSTPIVGLNDKRQITAVLAAATDGSFLPIQLIFQGKTSRCLPSQTERNEYEQIGWNFTMTENHWSNYESMVSYMSDIISQYLQYVPKNARNAIPFPYPVTIL